MATGPCERLIIREQQTAGAFNPEKVGVAYERQAVCLQNSREDLIAPVPTRIQIGVARIPFKVVPGRTQKVIDLRMPVARNADKVSGLARLSKFSLTGEPILPAEQRVAP